MALHPDRSDPVVATGQTAGLTPDAKVSSYYTVIRPVIGCELPTG